MTEAAQGNKDMEDQAQIPDRSECLASDFTLVLASSVVLRKDKGRVIGAAEGNKEMKDRHHGFGAYDVPFLGPSRTGDQDRGDGAANAEARASSTCMTLCFPPLADRSMQALLFCLLQCGSSQTMLMSVGRIYKLGIAMGRPC